MNASAALMDRDAGVPGARPRARRTLSRAELGILIVLGILPLLSIVLRILALPGIEAARLGGLTRIGDHLNQFLSLSDVPYAQRNHILYLLLIPTAATIVSLARLTLGLRVLAFRSILISVAFHQSGLVASFILMALAMAAVALLRPWLRHIELPYYARLSMMLCVLSGMMVGMLVLGPWMRSELAWQMLAFPVIALGFLGEGIARAVDRDHFLRAIWIGLNTVGIAALMALVFWIPAVRSFLLRFPEIVLTQTIAVVMIAKYLDLQLLQHWDEKLMTAVRSKAWLGGRRVAVIRNRIEPGTRSPRTLRSVQTIVDALRQARYKVRVMEGDASLPRELRRFFPENPRTGERDGVVLNLAQGSRGDAGTTHVPAMLEVFGVPYSGPTPLGSALTFDRVASRVLMRQAGVPTPAFRLLPTAAQPPEDLRYPVLVAPRYELNARPVVVSDRRQLRARLRKLNRGGVEEAFVEQHRAGRPIAVALLGNDPIECLPLVEMDSDGGKLCPAPIGEATAERVCAYAHASFRACGCRDYGRVDVHLDEQGKVWVLEVRTLGILASQGAFARAGIEAGYTFSQLLARIVEVTHARARGRATSQPAARSAPAFVHADSVGSP